MKETVDRNILIKSGNSDGKFMQTIKITSETILAVLIFLKLLTNIM